MEEQETVWEFTNQQKLTASEFITYIEKKVFATIRKYHMLPKEKEILLQEDDLLTTAVLKHILEKKFPVSFSNKPYFSSENLSSCAQEIFQNVLMGNFTGPLPKDTRARPLYFVSDKELVLYASLTGISGKEREKKERIQKLFSKFMEKNPDLENNIVNALKQVPSKNKKHENT